MLRGKRGRDYSPRMPSLLARFISHAATLRQILTAAEDVTDQPVSAVEAVVRGRERVACIFGRRPLRPLQAGLDQGPASTDPVAVATVHELVRAARKAALGSVLSRG